MDHGRLAAAIALAAVAGGCRAGVPTPPFGPHDASEPWVTVGSMPPTVRVEIVPAPPKEQRDPRWIDGQWLWGARAGEPGGGRWRWVPGQWVEWRGAKGWYAPPEAIVSGGGWVQWRRGITRTPSAEPAAAPAPAATR